MQVPNIGATLVGLNAGTNNFLCYKLKPAKPARGCGLRVPPANPQDRLAGSPTQVLRCDFLSYFAFFTEKNGYREFVGKFSCN